MSLLLAHPEIPKCADCVKYVYEPKTWKLRQERGQQGVPAKRPARDKPPCDTCPKCPVVGLASPEEGRKSELTLANQRAVNHFFETRHAMSRTERDDAICRRTRGIMESLLFTASQQQGQASLAVMMAMGGLKK